MRRRRSRRPTATIEGVPVYIVGEDDKEARAKESEEFKRLWESDEEFDPEKDMPNIWGRGGCVKG